MKREILQGAIATAANSYARIASPFSARDNNEYLVFMETFATRVLHVLVAKWEIWGLKKWCIYTHSLFSQCEKVVDSPYGAECAPEPQPLSVTGACNENIHSLHILSNAPLVEIPPDKPLGALYEAKEKSKRKRGQNDQNGALRPL